MTSDQRQAAFNRYFTALARSCAEKRGLGFAGTIRKLPPPPLPGHASGSTRYYLNAVSSDGSAPALLELRGEADKALRRAEAWLETGKGPPPALTRTKAKVPKLKRKV